MSTQTSLLTFEPRRRRASRLATLFELTRALRNHGRWWLIPFVAVMAFTAILMIAVQVIEYFAPFVYTLL